MTLYVLFNGDDETIGVSDYVRPMTRGIYVDDPEGLTKRVLSLNAERGYSPDGQPLYVDKHGVVSTNRAGQPYYDEHPSEELVSVVRYPRVFSMDDVLEYRREELLRDTPGAVECRLYEVDFDPFVDLEASVKVDVSRHYVKVRQGGRAVFNFPAAPGVNRVVVRADGAYSLGGSGNGKAPVSLREGADTVTVSRKANAVVLTVTPVLTDEDVVVDSVALLLVSDRKVAG